LRIAPALDCWLRGRRNADISRNPGTVFEAGGETLDVLPAKSERLAGASMIELPFPEIAVSPVSLVPPTVRGARGEESAPVRDRLRVGKPVVQRLDVALAGEDPELVAFLDDAQDAFCLVHLGCTFVTSDAEPFERAWLTLSLARADEAPVPLPIVWSMRPMRLTSSVDASRTVRVGVKAMLVDVGLESTASTKGDVWFVEALGLQESVAGWDFRRTAAEEISGTQRLSSVVRVPAGASLRGRIELGATISRRRLGVFPYEAAWPDPRDAAFEYIPR
jgi:hypothetical protein